MPAPPMPLRCSIVIATLDRVASLRVVLDCLRRQTRLPHEVVVAAAGDATAVQALAHDTFPFSFRVLPSAEKSSARQRNAAAAETGGEILAFLDDDIEFDPDLLDRMLSFFEGAADTEVGAASPRVIHSEGHQPGRLARLYYRVQAGYSHPDYGGRLFGAGINCLPVLADAEARVRADWLPATCLFVRAPLFQRHRFPEFTGYSFAEDVHLTARIARSAPLYFLGSPAVVHHSLPSEFKADRADLTAGKLHNMARVAREVMGLDGFSLWWRWQLHRLFLSVAFLRRGANGWPDLRGVWRAKW